MPLRKRLKEAIVSTLSNDGSDVAVEDNLNLQSSNEITNASAVSTDQADITNEARLELTKSATTSLSSGTYKKIPFANVVKDDRGEWDTTSNTFRPDATGSYFISLSLDFSSGSNGDRRNIRVRNDKDNDILSKQKFSSQTFENITISGMKKLDSARDYRIEARNNNSDDSIRVNDDRSFVTIRSAFRED